MGGAIFNHGGTLGITNSTLTANLAAGGGSPASYGGASGLGGGPVQPERRGHNPVQHPRRQYGRTGGSPGFENTAAGGAVYSVGYNLVAGQAATAEPREQHFLQFHRRSGSGERPAPQRGGCCRWRRQCGHGNAHLRGSEHCHERRLNYGYHYRVVTPVGRPATRGARIERSGTHPNYGNR